MAQLAIKGHATRGKEIIEILEMLGGKNTHDYICNMPDFAYSINEQGIIEWFMSRPNSLYTIFTLEEFLEKYPYKVGDKVKVCGDNLGVIIGMRWESDYVVYKVKLSENGYETSKTSENLQPYKEETMEKNIIDTIKESEDRYRIKVNYQFDIEVDEGEYYAVRRKPQYPKTYEECAQILLERASVRNDIGYKGDLLIALQRLLVCRDAYWKIAGEQMGIDKPWKPDACQIVYSIGRDSNRINLCNDMFGGYFILEFPTEEMRDTFYENFKELIEQCKELL